MLLLCLFALQLISVPYCLGQDEEKQDPKGEYYLGFSSYHDRQMALSEVARLKEQGYRALYQEAGQGDEAKYRVLVGPYATKGKATVAGKKLKEKGLVDKIKVVSQGTSQKDAGRSDRSHPDRLYRRG